MKAATEGQQSAELRSRTEPCAATLIDTQQGHEKAHILTKFLVNKVQPFVTPVEYALKTFALGDAAPVLTWTENVERG